MAEHAPSSSARLKPLFSRRYAALWIALAANIILGVLYLWSRGGATIELHIEVDGARYEASLDGELFASATGPGAGADRLSIGIQREGVVPTLPGPAGIDLVRITDRTTGEVVFEDRFDEWQPDVWDLDLGEAIVRDGVFSTGPTFASISTQIEAWGNHTVTVLLKNLTQVSVTIRDGPDAIALRTWPFARYDSGIDLVEGGTVVERTEGGELRLHRGQTLKSITAMLLRPYPLVLVIVAVMTALAMAARLPADQRLRDVGLAILARAHLAVLLLAALALAFLSYVILVLGEGMPHVPDSAAYVFQAKIIAGFQITADAPPVFRSFTFHDPSPMQVVDGRWFSQYPFGHPLLLSIGQLVGAMWLIPPLLGAACLLLIYRVGSHVYGAAAGLLAALLLAFSPFFQMTASNLMSHNSAVFAILMCLFLYVRPTRHRAVSMAVSGAFLGLLFNIRPLPAVALMIPLAGLFGYDLLRAQTDRLRLLREYAAFAGGAVLLFLAYLGYNQLTTGDPFTTGYTLTNTYSEDSFGFGGDHSIARGLQNLQQLLAYMLLVANGWPVAIGLSLAALPFVLGTRNRWDYFLAASALTLAIAIIFYRNAAVMHGPRFWYETMPFLMLLSARGIVRLWETSIAMSDWLTARFGRARREAAGGIAGAALVALVLGLIAFSSYGWMLGQRDAWSGIAAVPQKLSMLEGFNNADGRLLDRADEMNLTNALVLVESCAHWWCYGSVFWTNSPDLDSDVVWAQRSTPEVDSLLLDSFEGRSLYVADYDTGTIRPASRTEIISGGDAPEEPLAP